MSPASPCLQPGCPNFATYRGYCPDHARQVNSEAGNRKAGREVYNRKRWKRLRKAKLGANPICERCQATLATEVHHVEGVEHDAWNIEGLESLCAPCHSRETRREQVSRAG